MKTRPRVSLTRVAGRACPALWSATAVAAAGLLVAGCMVESKCHSDYDCSSNETCELGSGACYVECTHDSHCLDKGSYVGKDCVDNRCTFRLDERTPAPNFCLDVVNPKSEHHGKKLCVAQLKGKVVFLFFGLMA